MCDSVYMCIEAVKLYQSRGEYTAILYKGNCYYTLY